MKSPAAATAMFTANTKAVFSLTAGCHTQHSGCHSRRSSQSDGGSIVSREDAASPGMAGPRLELPAGDLGTSWSAVSKGRLAQAANSANASGRGGSRAEQASR